jgi:hypothetical protein
MDTLRALRVLGLPPSATAEEIKGAWRDLTKVWHPDRFPHDERLRQKAGANLQRINEAHEALRNYDPAKSPKLVSRMRESVAIILGMGDLGDPPPVPPQPPARATPEQPLTPSAPIGLRHSLRILGLGVARQTGEAGSRRSAGPPVGRVMAIVLALAALAIVAYLLR